MTSPQPTRLDLVWASWCPHCEPLSSDRARRLADGLGIQLRILDIDVPAEERVADDLVQRFGDWTPDYLVPQLFLEWSDGRIDHLLTGDPRGVDGTLQAWSRVWDRFGLPTEQT